jgi:hypothetical protein
LSGARRDRLLHDYVQSFDPRLDEDPMTNCGSEHGKVVTRLDGHDAQLADHETRIRTGERRGADVAGKLLWVFVTAVICGAVSLVVTLLTAAEGG